MIVEKLRLAYISVEISSNCEINSPLHSPFLQQPESVPFGQLHQ